MRAFLSRITGRTPSNGRTPSSGKTGARGRSTTGTGPRSRTAKGRPAKSGTKSGAAKSTAAKGRTAKDRAAKDRSTESRTAKGRTAGGKRPGGASTAGAGEASKGAAEKKSGGRAEGKSAAAKGPRKGPATDDSAAQAVKERQGPHGLVRASAMLLAFGGMVAFAVVLSRLTLEPSNASASIAHTNLQPGASIRAYLSQPAFQDTVKQLGGNIVLGVPFGVLLPVLVPRARSLLRVTLASAAVMLLVELVQGALIHGRAFDIDDVILNSTGAFIGYLLLGRRLGRAVHPPRRRWWQRWLGGPVSG